MKSLAKVFLGLLLTYYVLPIIGTIAFSLASSWSGTLLPSGFTLEWYVALFQEPEFIESLINSVLVATVSALALSLVIVVVVLVVELYTPKLHAYLKVIEITPYVIPGVVLAIGILTIFSSIEVSDFFLLVGAYLIILFPFAYRSLSNRLNSIRVKEAINASRVLGVSDRYCLVHVIIPQMTNTLLAIALISFSGILAEYTFVRLLVGGRFKTLSQYLFKLKSLSAHMGAAANIFIMVIIFSFALSALMILRKEQKHVVSKH